MIKCGKHVDATICPNGHQYGDVEGMREKGYSCKSDSLFVQEKGIKVSGSQHLSKVDLFSENSSVILSLHPWNTKGAAYLGLDRDEKSEIIWDKIT